MWLETRFNAMAATSGRGGQAAHLPVYGWLEEFGTRGWSNGRIARSLRWSKSATRVSGDFE
jgi:hypothetical protein